MARPKVGGRGRPTPKKGEFTENRVAWVKTAIAQCVLMLYPERDGDKEPGPTVKVLIPQQSARTLTLDLTHLTSEELSAMRKLFDMAFELAEPIVAERDRVAQDAFTSGDDSYSRSYRQVPQFIVRQGKVSQHGQGVHDGPANLPQSGGGGEGGALGVRGAGGDMADNEPSEGQPQDDGPTAG